MNYYIVNNEVFETLDKNNIKYKLHSVDKSKNIVVTSDNISTTLESFNTVYELSEYTFDNLDIFGPEGIDVFDIKTGAYFPELDK